MKSIPSATQNITIESNVITLTVNNDESRVISFDPSDINFVSALYELIEECDAKEKEYQIKEEETIDIKGKIKLAQEFCEFARYGIDKVFGDGTSNTAFGKSNSVEMFAAFFNAVTPFVEDFRKKRLQKYKANKTDVMT